MASEPPWYRTNRGIAVVVLYAVLTLLAITLSTEPRLPMGDSYLDVSDANGPSTAIPPAIYLYGFLGAMAYAFTSVVGKFERGPTGVARVGLRVLAALPLAAGVFLLAGALGIEAPDGRLLAGMAFLVGLYVSLTLKALGGLAERLLGVRSGGDNADQGSGGPETE